MLADLQPHVKNNEVLFHSVWIHEAGATASLPGPAFHALPKPAKYEDECIFIVHIEDKYYIFCL